MLRKFKTIGCRVINPETIRISESLEKEKDVTSAFVLDQPEEEVSDSETEIDPVNDPIVPDSNYPDTGWEQQIRGIKVREPKIPSEEEQRSRMAWVLSLLDSEKSEPDSSQVEEASRWLTNLESIIPDHNEFVASNFYHFFPAWKELLKGANRKSARSVLSWLKNGFKPKFGGTEQAKPSKREIVESMLRRVVKPSEVPRMLWGRYPHPVAFQNHQSLYKNWARLQ
jgi:hypothetical protein